MGWGSNSKIEQKAENVCSFCGLFFRSWDELHQHKLKAKDHITCPKCSQDFNTPEGFRLHHVQMHSAEQDLLCEKCNQRFTRVGGLVGHIENGQCDLVSKARFRQTLLGNQKKEDDREHQRNVAVYGRTAGDFGNESPATVASKDKKYLQPGNDGLKPESRTPSIINELQTSDEDSENGGAVLVESDDLISFNAPSHVLNSAWGQPVSLPSRVDNGQKATQRVTQTVISNSAPKKAENIYPYQGAVASGLQLPPGQIPPHLRHLYGKNRLSIKTENYAEGVAVDTARLSAASSTSCSSTPRNPVQTSIPSNLQQPSVWPDNAALVSDQKSRPTPNRTATGQLAVVATAHAVFFSNTPKDFPALQTQHTANSTRNIMDTPNIDPKKKIVALGAKKNLFPEAPTAVAPPIGLMDSLTVSTPEELNPFDPSTPGFNVMEFWIPFTKKFKCPYKGCKKSLETGLAFTQHLRSAAHRDDKLRCSTCLRYFTTATALTQHSESQGKRCKAREQSLYTDEVEKFTAGAAAVGGLHDDETLKYVLGPMLNPAIDAVRAAKKADTEALGEELNALDALRAANRAANDSKAERFNSFWDNHNPKW